MPGNAALHSVLFSMLLGVTKKANKKSDKLCLVPFLLKKGTLG